MKSDKSEITNEDMFQFLIDSVLNAENSLEASDNLEALFNDVGRDII